jgi:hypothetical protein
MVYNPSIKCSVLQSRDEKCLRNTQSRAGAVRQLTKLVEESTRATGESVKYFIEPTPGVLDKAKNKRHYSAVEVRENPAYCTKLPPI